MNWSDAQRIVGAVPTITNRFGRNPERGGLGMGVRAVLRRLDPDAPEDALGAVCAVLVAAGITVETLDSALLMRASLALHVLALLSGSGNDPHNPAIAPGRGMADGGLSEARFVRLLTARGPVFRDQIVRVARYLAASGQKLDCRPLVELIIVEGEDEDRAERVRLQLAQHFYPARYRQKNAEAAPAA
jgi:CRISPR system Cascade subunit CasB